VKTCFNGDIYLYSAYCIDSEVIIIAIIKDRISHEYKCQLIDENWVFAQVIELPEHHSTIYQTYFLLMFK
jgi:hypothetical protein